MSATETARRIDAACADAELAECGECGAGSHIPCEFASGQADHGGAGYHMARFAAARSAGLISAADMTAVIEAAGVFTTATVIRAGTR
jgi:hypothetical protein